MRSAENSVPPLEQERRIVCRTVPALRFAPSGEWRGWQKTAREKLGELLGMAYFERCEECFAVESEADGDGFHETVFSFDSEPGCRVTCHLLTPAGLPLNERRGLAVCLQGHSSGMHISLGRAAFPGDEQTLPSRDYALQALREGWCALAMDQRCFGDRGGRENGSTDCLNTALTALMSGRTLLGGRVWDVSRALDAVAGHFAQVDMSRVLCTGNSGGGTTTIYAAALEPRITAAVPCCSFCSWAGSIAAVEHCACNYVPQIARFFDMGELAGLSAPRVFLAAAGREDPIFALDGVREAFARAQAVYEAAGAADGCRLAVGEGGHRYYPDLIWPALREMGVRPN